MRRPVLWMAAALLLGELCAAGYAVIVIWGLLISLLPLFIGRSLWKYKKTELLLISLAFMAGVLLVKYSEEPKEAFGYVESAFDVTVKGEVLSMKDSSYYSNVILEESTVLYEGEEYFIDGVLLYLSDVSSLEIGDVIAVSGKLSSFSYPRNDGEFNLYNYYKSQGIYYLVTADENTEADVIAGKSFPLAEWLFDLRERLSEGLCEHCYSIKDAGTMSAIMLGEKEYLDDGLKEAFQISGISHILVVSGLHISLVGMGIYKLLKRLLGHLPACILSSVFVILYVCMTGFGTSGQRALIMFLVAMLGGFIGRSYDLCSGIGFALICMLIKTPYLFLNSGFVLSYLSVFAIGTLLPFLEDMSKWAFEKKLSGSMAGIAIFWMTLPIVVWNYYEYSLYSLILNLLVLPCMSLLVILGAGGLLGESLMGIGSLLLKGPVHIILLYYEKLSLFFNEMSVGRIMFGRPKLWQVLCVYTLLSFVLCACFIIRQLLKKQFKFPKVFFNKKIKLFVFVAVVIGVSLAEIWLLLPKNSGELRITMLDVGQGEGIFIETPTGERLLIDCGSTDVRNLYEKRVLPFFKSNAVKSLDYIIVSHADTDHCSAIKDILATDSGVEVKALILPDVNGEDESIAELLRLGQSKGCKLQSLGRGDVLRVGEVELYCINPDSEAFYTEEERNDSSIVLHMKYLKFDMLFTGDISEGAERRLASFLKQCEVLKVAHHGSKYSNSKSLLDKINPQVALISCSADNSYGHPHEETLLRLKEAGSTVMSTAKSGAVTIIVGKSVEIYEFAENE